VNDRQSLPVQVGGEVARRAKGLGFDVIAYDPYASEAKAQALGVRLVTFDDALAQADFFSLHMPMTPDTKGMLGDAAFAKMKKGARVVNVARGGVIDEDALVRALDAGIVAQVCMPWSLLSPRSYQTHVAVCGPLSRSLPPSLFLSRTRLSSLPLVKWRTGHMS
jgi:D-3-phosphoglycerate dehydrogenase